MSQSGLGLQVGVPHHGRGRQMALGLDLAQHRHRIGGGLREVAEGVHHVEHGVGTRREGRREAGERRGAHIVAAGINDDDRAARLVAVGLRRRHGQLAGD